MARLARGDILDEPHLYAAFRYVALNPVRAGLAVRAQDWAWSSARAQLGLGEDGLTAIEATRRRVPDFAELLADAQDDEAMQRLRRAESIGRPAGSAEFLDQLEQRYGRTLKPAKRGPRKREFSALSP